MTSLVQHELEKKVTGVMCYIYTFSSHLLQVVETQDVTGGSWGPGNTSPDVSGNEAALVSV